MTKEVLIYAIPVFGLLGLAFTFWKSAWVVKQDPGTERMKRREAKVIEDKTPDLEAAYSLETPDDNRRLYRDWAQTYDSDFAERSGYRSARLTAQAYLEAGGTWPLLDAGCGTGLVAESLPAGAVIDGIDISPEMLEVFKTGVFYQFIHTIVLLTLSLTNIIKSNIASMFFLAGIILFSFSLYIYSTSGIKFFAMITPIGGICFLIGWLWIIVEAVRIKQGK